MNIHLFRNTALAASLIAALLGAPVANGVVLYTNDFATTADGWTGTGDWTFSYSSGDGGRLQGDFAAQSDPPSYGEGFWSSPVIGDLTQSGTYALTQLVFDFYALNFAPSSLTVWIGDGVNLISRGVTGLTVGANMGVAVDLSSSTGWGGDTSQFSSILDDIAFVEFQVVRAGVTNAQSFQLDSFQIEGGAPPAPPAAVPEPDVVNLMAFFCLVALAMRRSLISRTVNV